MNASKRVWITGASSGIGRHLALRYAKSGATVYVSARSSDKLDTLVAESSTLPGSIVASPLDVTDSAAITAFVESLNNTDALPHISILNAGFYQPVELNDLSLTHFEQTFDVNYLGVVRCLLAVLPHYRSTGSGHIVIVSSVAGYSGLPRAAAYGSSKAALINLAESLEPECRALGVSVSLVNPGFVRTPLTDKNTFHMPFLLEPETAAERIFHGIASGRFEISFPKRFTWLLKLLRILPYPLFLRITRRLV